MNRIRPNQVILALIPIIVYLALALPNLRLPGIYYDEVLQVLPAMDAVGYDIENDYLNLPGTVVNLGGYHVPLLTMPYLGSLETMMFVPVFLTFEPSVEIIRGVFILLGAIALGLVFVWVSQMFDTRTALVSALLLATDGSYVFFTRADNGPVDTMMIIKLCMLIAYGYWWKTGKARGLYAGAFLTGLGIYDKANFLWLIAAGAFVLALFAFKEVWARIRGNLLQLIIATVLLIIGASPFLVYVLLRSGGPFSSLLSSFGNTAFGVNNLQILDNLRMRGDSFVQMVSGYEALNQYLYAFTEKPVPFPATLQFYMMILAAIVPPGLYFWQRRRFDWPLKITCMLVVLIVLLLLLSTVTPTTLSSHHLVIIYPFPQLLIAHSAWLVYRLIQSKADAQSSARRWLRPQNAVGAILSLTILSNVAATIQGHIILTQTQGIAMWSAAIYDLNDYLMAEQKTVICMDWGLCHNLQVLSLGHLQTEDRWSDFLYPTTDTSEMESLLTRSDTVFVFHAPAKTGVFTITDEDYPRRSLFEAAEDMGLELQLTQTISQANGEPLYEIYTVVGN